MAAVAQVGGNLAVRQRAFKRGVESVTLLAPMLRQLITCPPHEPLEQSSAAFLLLAAAAHSPGGGQQRQAWQAQRHPGHLFCRQRRRQQFQSQGHPGSPTCPCSSIHWNYQICSRHGSAHPINCTVGNCFKRRLSLSLTVSPRAHTILVAFLFLPRITS
jgi:hypothetical protein